MWLFLFYTPWDMAGQPKRGRKRFLLALEQTASVVKACELASIGRSTVYDWRDNDPEFAKDWDAAIERGCDALEDEAVRRAHEGYDRPVYQGGERVGVIREYSDTLLIFLLKGRRPNKYRDRGTFEHTGKDGAPLALPGAIQIQLVAPERK